MSKISSAATTPAVSSRSKKRPILQFCSRVWHTIQVELHGQYSDAQLKRFAKFQASTSWWRVVFVCCVTPLPSIAFVALTGLIALEPIENGASGSPNVWTVYPLLLMTISCCGLIQTCHHVPELRIGWVEFLLVPTISAPSAAAVCYALATVVGYPLPYTMIFGAVPWFTVLRIVMGVRKAKLIRATPGLSELHARYNLFAFTQINMTMIYPFYAFIYKNLQATYQALFILVLPLLKIANKVLITRTAPDPHNSMPEAVIFNVEVFHALFVSICVGNTTLWVAMALLMAIDAVHAWISFRDVHDVLHQFQSVTQTHDLLLLVQTLTSSSVARVAPEPREVVRSSNDNDWTDCRGPETVDLRDNLSKDAHVATLIRKLLYITEFIVLVEYAEVAVPVIHYVTRLALFQLPNREYFEYFKSMCSVFELVAAFKNVAVYSLLELASLVLMALVAWRMLRISLCHQLAFVLEERVANFQAKLLLWVPYLIINELDQYGVDFTFQFKWLHVGASSLTATSHCHSV